MQASPLPLQVTGMCLDFLLGQVLNLCFLLVLRANNLPRLKAISHKETRFYVTVAAGARTWHTRTVRSLGNCAEWNEHVDTL
jgi:hypothetical protein